MTPPASLRVRLNRLIGLAMLLSVTVGFGFAIHDARRSIRDEARSSVNLALQLIEAGLIGADHSEEAIARWMQRLQRMDQIRHLEIRLSDQAFAAAPTPPMSVATPVPAWFRWAVAPTPITIDKQLQSDHQPSLSLRITADADDEIAEAWSETQGILLLLMCLAGTVYTLVHIIVGRAFSPIETILEGLGQIEHGAFDKRLPHFSLPEFERLSAQFNHMAATLETARQQNQALIRHSLAIQEEERRVLAQELHDEFGQCLTAIKVMGATLRQPTEAPGGAAEQIMGLCDRLFGVMRSMMRRLRPAVLEDLGLKASLEDLISQWHGSHPDLRLTLRCDAGLERLDPDLALQLYRIVQEGLTNIVKHAGATEGQIHVSHPTPGWIELVLRDNGRGFDPTAARPGFGLSGIRERVAGLDGQVELETRPGTGLSLRLRVPMESTRP